MIGRRSFLGGLTSFVLGRRWLKPLPAVYGELSIKPQLIDPESFAEFVSQPDVIMDVKAMIAAIETAPVWAPSLPLHPGDLVELRGPGNSDESVLFQIKEESFSVEGGHRLKLRSL